jgi:hypothetical protein
MKRQTPSRTQTLATKKKPAPDKITLRSYQVGFGDCYLLSFHYGATARHILIDFGTTALPKHLPDDQMMRVARDIRERCQGKLHLVVATHRHADHISGFATNAAGTASGDIIRSCNPEVVLQPWTENPDAATDAVNATAFSSGETIPFAQTLAHMQDVAAAIAEQAKHLGFSLNPKLADQLAFLGEDNISNKSAVLNLMEMGRRGKALYLHADFNKPLALTKLLPGVKVWALGPPTLEQSDAIKSQRAKDPNEFWHLKQMEKDAVRFWQLQAAAGRPAAGQGQLLFPDVAIRSATQLTPPYTRAFIRRMHSIRGSQLLEIVRILDNAMNNTSLILLFEAGGKTLLFPGDAQIENWSFALGEPAIRARLAEVDVYKVGHHGSLNATPKTLWESFARKNEQASPKRLQTFVSTMAGKHGSVDKKTEVPRETLVTALQKMSTYFSTQTLTAEDDLSREFTIKLG